MEKYRIAADFNGTGLVPYLSANTTAIPLLWPVIFFVLWLFINAAAYFAILKTTGKKRFLHTTTATSFVVFLMTIPIAAMNGTNNITFLSGYWVAFYLMLTVIFWYILGKYK